MPAKKRAKKRRNCVTISNKGNKRKMCYESKGALVSNTGSCKYGRKKSDGKCKRKSKKWKR